MRTNYFGTDLTTAGHYFFEVRPDYLSSNRNIDFADLPFNPEKLPIVVGNRYAYAPKGMTRFYNFGHWSICAIGGSAIDSRHGCHSVFFWDEVLTQDQMIDIIKSLPIAVKMINQMPFKVEIFKPDYISG